MEQTQGRCSSRRGLLSACVVPASAMYFGASRFIFDPAWCVRESRTQSSFRGDLRPCHRESPDISLPSRTSGTKVAALQYVKTKLNWVVVLAFGLLASLALPASDA